MDIKKILNTDYLDILFDGRNKKYGSYQLRKNYNRYIIIGAIFTFLAFGGFFLSTLIEPSEKEVVEEKPIIKDVALAEPPPLDETNHHHRLLLSLPYHHHQ